MSTEPGRETEREEKEGVATVERKEDTVCSVQTAADILVTFLQIKISEHPKAQQQNYCCQR